MKRIFYSLLCLALYTTVQAAPSQVFVPNKGQIADTKGQLHPEILFKYESDGANLYFLKDRLIYHFMRSEAKTQADYNERDRENQRNGNLGAIGKKVYFHRLDLVFQNANPNVELVSEEKTTTYSNFYLGHCPKGITNVEHYGKLVYKNIYQGIDLAFYFKDGKLKYDFIVSPGADHHQVKLVYEGAENIEQLSSGEILVKTPAATLTEGLPYTYDKQSGKEIPSKYILDGTSIRFSVGENLQQGTTVIDPTVTWSTYFNNGSSSDTWTKPAFDATGAFYNAGYTYYATYPLINAGGGQYFDNTKDGITDLVIVKFASNYAYTWSTYYGGNGGDYLAGYTDYGKALAVDGSNNVYVAGSTDVNVFPTFNPGGGAFYQDQSRIFSETSFFVKLNSAGVRQWASMYQHEAANTMSGGIRVNGICIGNGNLYFTGQTYRFNSNDVPIRSLAGAYNNATWKGPQDVFIGRFNGTTMALEWSSYLNDGGSATASYRQGCDLHYENSGLWFVGRHTVSSSNAGHYLLNPGGGAYYQATNAGDQDLIITKFNTSMGIVYSTYYGGDNQDIPSMINCNTAGDAVVTLRAARSSNLPVQDPGGGAYYQPTRAYVSASDADAAILKFSSAGVRQWATYYGGSAGPSLFSGVGFDNSNNIYVFGSTQANNFPVQNEPSSYNDNTMSGTGDVVLLRFTNGGVRQWSTYYGGGATESLYSPKGEVASSGCSVKLLTFPYTNSSDFPTTNPGGGAFFEGTASTTNVNTILLLEESVGGLSTAASSASATAPTICSGSSTTLSVTGGTLGTSATWQWYSGSCGGTLVGSGSSISVSPTSTTTYFVRAEGLCNTTTCVSVTVTVNTPSTPPASASATSLVICAGNSTTLSATGGSLGTGANWQWYSGSCGGTAVGSGSSISVSPTVTTTYFVRAEGTCNNTTCASVTITVNTPSVAPTSISATSTTICSGNSTTLTVSGGSLGTAATWQWYTGSCGGTFVGTGISITVSPVSTTTYFVRAEGTCNNTVCASQTITVNTPSTAPASASATAATICAGSSTTLSVTGGSLGTAASWQWYSGSCAGTLVGSGSSISVSPTATTTYFVRAEGPCNTTTCASVTVTVNTLSTDPALISATSTNICIGTSSTLSVGGGSLGTGANWQWYSGSCGGTPVGSGSSISVSPTVATTYFVRAEGTCNTTACASVTITVNTNSTAPTGITPSATTVCTGNNVTLTATGGSLGTGAQFTWYTSSCGGTTVGTGTSITVPVSTATDFYVNAVGTCNSTTCVMVTINTTPGNTPPTAMNASANPICAGTPTTLSFTGGSLEPGASWQWYSGSCGGTPVGSGSSITVSPTTTTNYFVRAEGGACGSSACQNILITVNTLSTDPTSISPSSTSACAGSSVTLTAVGGSAGTGAAYTWYEGACSTTPIGTGTSIPVSPTATTTYFVNIVGSCNTTVCQQVTINLDASNVAPTSINASETNLCAASTITLTQVGGSLGTGAQYTWYEGSCGGTPIGSGSTITVSPAAPTAYYVNVTGGCNTTSCALVVISAAPASAAWNPPPSGICSSADLDLNTLLGSTPTGGTWYGPGVTGSMFNPTGMSGSVTLSYVLGSGFCKDSVAHTVNILPAPAAPVVSTSASTICSGQSATISTTASADVYTAATGGTLVGATPLVVSPTTTTTYFVESISTSGCVNEGGRVSVTINVLPSPTANAGPNAQICAGDDVTLTATGGGTYSWNTGPSTAAITVSPSNDMTYWVTVTSGGCSDTDTVQVNVITSGDVVAVDDNVTMTSANPISVNVAGNDSGDPSTVTIVAGPLQGTATVSSSGQIVYTPNPGFIGTDILTYSICSALCQNVCNTAQLTIVVDREIVFNIPGGISPNGDGINDVWNISGIEFYPQNELVIFNRWGDKVYSASPYQNDWHGQSNNTSLRLAGDEVVDGTYFFVLKLSPDEKPLNGPIELIRNK